MVGRAEMLAIGMREEVDRKKEIDWIIPCPFLLRAKLNTKGNLY